ncbi:PBPRA1643 family SWIM/SEC-C metal-binding motif protein [Agarivorans aestuarii]|uniref:PBPRA1643 family SWIM/SEC-C metal-binding motif protein n=1 Tax=Agarivorans aestuarii TaxID=1563703 RepID=UPI001C7EBF5E|nr:PBPRA1643 family SWIM/SEC-C metal-binding motif protein [Agarivorans aestuarii]
MSKFFFKGRIEKKPKHESFGFNTKREAKIGTEENPLPLLVNSEERKIALSQRAAEHRMVVDITVDSEAEENIEQLELLIAKPSTKVVEKTPKRNDPCSCGSGKKFKKCCG